MHPRDAAGTFYAEVDDHGAEVDAHGAAVDAHRTDVDDAGRTNEKGAGACQPLHAARRAGYFSASTDTLMVAFASLCKSSTMSYSPRCLSGPCGRRTAPFTTSKPCTFSASAMS